MLSQKVEAACLTKVHSIAFVRFTSNGLTALQMELGAALT
jgi:hypothetical protein